MGRRCAGPGWPRRACAEGGGWRRRHKGRDRGEKGGWKRRMPVVPSPRYESANSLLPPGFSRYPLSLSLFSLYFSFSPLSSLSDHSRVSVFLASYHRTVPPASRRPINRVISPPCFDRKVCRSSKTASSAKSDRLFFFPLYIHNQSNRFQKRFFAIRSSRSIILRFTCRRVEKCVSSHEHLFFSRIRGERERKREKEKCARSRVLCENGFSRRDGYSRLGQRLAYSFEAGTGGFT